MMSYCIVCSVAKTRRIYLDVSLARSVSLPVLVLDFLLERKEKKIKSTRDSYLFDKHYGLIIMLKCNILSHAKLA